MVCRKPHPAELRERAVNTVSELRRRPLFVREGGNHSGNCSKIAPSLPAWGSGCSAARNRSHAASATVRSTSFRYTRSFPVS